MRSLLLVAAVAVLLSGCCCRSRRHFKLEADRLPDSVPMGVR